MSAEPLSYVLGLMGLYLLASSAVGWIVAWLTGLALEAAVPSNLHMIRTGLGVMLVFAGIIMWSVAHLPFIVDAAAFGLGVGFLLEAGRQKLRARAQPKPVA